MSSRQHYLRVLENYLDSKRVLSLRVRLHISKENAVGDDSVKGLDEVLCHPLGCQLHFVFKRQSVLVVNLSYSTVSLNYESVFRQTNGSD